MTANTNWIRVASVVLLSLCVFGVIYAAIIGEIEINNLKKEGEKKCYEEGLKVLESDYRHADREVIIKCFLIVTGKHA